jgi:hypothetical protein
MKHELIQTENYLLVVDDSKKTIAHLPINGAPVIEGVDLLPPIEGEVGELANIFSNGFQLYLSLDMVGALREGFVSGYNKAKEKYKFTEQHLIDAYDRGLNNIDFDGCAIDNPSDDINDFIQSFQQPKMPVGFECAYQSPEDRYYEDGIGYDLNIKRTTNLEGQTVWVGKYIFND